MSIFCGDDYSIEDLIRLTLVKPSGVPYIDCGETVLSLEDIAALVLGVTDEGDEGIHISTPDPNVYVVDEDGNFITDEEGNLIIL
jgi:hypothetical protein